MQKRIIKNNSLKQMISVSAQSFLAIGSVMIGLLGHSGAANAEKIENDIAVFAALDKVTARISTIEVRLNETQVFGSLKITPRVCYTRPPTEPPVTSSFVEVQEIKLDGSVDKLFTGWMFAQSPGLHGVEHPVFDVWLTNCKTDEAGTSDDNAEKSDLQDKARSNSR